MTAYDAAITLMDTIQRVLHPPPHVWIEPANPESLLSALDELRSLNQIHDSLDLRSYDKGGEKKKKALELFGSHFSVHFPTEYRIVQFANQHIKPYKELVRCERIRVSAMRELEGVAKSLLPKLKRSVVFEGEVIEEEEIDSFSQTVTGIKEEWQAYNDDMEKITRFEKKIRETILEMHEVNEGEKEEISSFLQKIKEVKEMEEEEIDWFIQKIRRIKEVDEWEEEEIDSLTQTIWRMKEYQRNTDRRGFVKIIVTRASGFKYFAQRVLESLVRKLRRNRSSRSSDRLDDLDGQIREAIHAFEDSLETHQLDMFLSQSDDNHKQLDLHPLNQDTGIFIQSVKKLKKEYYNELLNPLPGEDDNAVSSRTGFYRNESKMVGLADVFDKVRDHLVDDPYGKVVHKLMGMAGIGKTTLAKKLFEDQSIMSYFDLRVWVTVGPIFQLKKIMQDMLAQVVNPDDIEKIYMEGGEKLAYHLSKSLGDKRCLIVLDDVWDQNLWEHYLKRLFDNCNKIRVLITTRRCEKNLPNYFHMVRFLNKEESWNLLRVKVFGDNEPNPQLQKAGKKIAEHCEGLPLTIVTVAQILSKVEKTPSVEYWRKVADKKTSVFKDAYDQMMDVLYPSYEYLPQYLKAFFLYMGVFPQNHEISVSKLKMMWSAEGLYNKFYHGDSAKYASDCLVELISESVVLDEQRHNNNLFSVKTCCLHSAIWHLCIRAADRSKFFYVLNYSGDDLEEIIKSRRRFCIHKNMLFGIKVVYNSLASCPTTRSLLCTGLYHRYPVPIYFGLRLLKVLDALNIRFYEFPRQLMELFLLRYLALTCDREPPRFVSQLWNLEYMILSRHQRIIKLHEDELDLPREIWGMKELKHLQVMGSNLPNPPHDGGVLPNLVKLLDVSPRTCTESVLQALPRLAKLGIQIEQAPNNVVQPLSCFDHISLLDKLQSLECVIVNPVFMSKLPRASLSISSSTLKRLTLSGCGYSWEDMRVIAALPELRKLKLQCYAFRGPNWEVDEHEFPELGCLIIEDTDLVHWKVRNKAMRWLKLLILKNCYKLKEIPEKIGYDYSMKIRLFDCSRSAVASAKQIEYYGIVTVDVHSTVDGNHKS